MELYTEIQINAPPERVWRLLTDFASYPKWNPFIRRANGKPEKGEKLEVYLQPEGKGMTFRPLVLTVEPGRELRWLGHLLIPGLFDGEHIFIIEPLVAGGVRFIQREIITGGRRIKQVNHHHVKYRGSDPTNLSKPKTTGVRFDFIQFAVNIIC